LRKFLLIFLLSGFPVLAFLRAAEDSSLKRYDESIFVISNYSGVDASNTETRSVKELLDQNIGGFRFLIEWEKVNNRLLLKGANGSHQPVGDVLQLIKHALEKDPKRILTLFLDFNVNVNELISEFEESGLMSYVYRHDQDAGWPALKTMVDEQKRLVVFTMQEHRTSPDWLQYIWHSAVEPYFSLMDAPDFIGEFLKGDPKNDLLIYNEYNIQGTGDRGKMRSFNLNLNPYLLEHIKNVWAKTGKTPNFIMLDRYEPNINRVIYHLNLFKTLKGTVTFNTQNLDYVTWEGRNSLTSGKYCFPVGPGDNVTLTPRSPGYRFKPEFVAFGELSQSREQHFIASPLEINENLEAFYPFENHTRDISGHELNGNSIGVVFKRDSIRQNVAFFDNKSHIVLPKAEEFKLRDHDFTVAAWIKIEKFLPGKEDYCIVGTPTNSYQEGIHLVVRNRKPYFGFYSNDLEGNMIFEEKRWYHIVWRYTKLTGEQAIYVNGKLDSRSLGHPSYKGREKLYIGVAGFSWESNMHGYIDDLVVWSRTLGNEEIWGLSKNIIQVLPVNNFLNKYIFFIAAVLILLVVSGFYLLRKKIKSRNVNHAIVPVVTDTEQKKAHQKNFIQLFGDFKIVDKNGEDISMLFTPKLKQLFLVILVFSQKNKKGISTKELTDIVWPNHTYQNAKNSRGVTIRKLRLILEAMDKVDIVFHIDTWAMEFAGRVYCDYVECLKLLEYGNSNDLAFYSQFYSIVRKGEVFKDESHDWLDDFKGFIVNHVVDILIKFIRKLNPETDTDFIIKLADRILLADPVNEDALSYKLTALVKQNNYKNARFSYEKFTSIYLEMYGEKFTLPFDKIIEQGNEKSGKAG
jgi:two-component SAPR family response regulator